MPKRPPTHGQLQRLQRAPQERTRRREYDRQRAPDHSFYSSPAWRRVRLAHLRAEPLCRACKDAGRLTPATVVDHIQERRDRPELALDDANLRSACVSCHNARTARESGGFGNKKRT